MGNAIVTLPDGRRAKVTFDTEDQLNAAVADLTQTTEQPKPKPEGNLSTGIGEAATQVATGMAGTVAGGLKGIWDVATGQGIDKAAEDIQHIQQGMTYQPRTQAGEMASKAVGYIPQKIAQAGDWAGGKVAEGATAMGASPEVAGGLGAAVNTGLQFAAPTAILKGGKALLASRAAETAAEASGTSKGPGARKEPFISETPQEAAARTQKEAETRAKDYASTKLAVDWDALSASFKKTLTDIATDAKKLDSLPVEAVKRQAQLQSLKVPVTTTAGKLTRDSTQLRNEANVAATDAGKPIRDIDIQTNRDLRANVEQLKQRVGGVGTSKATAATPEQVGEAAQGALRTKEAVSKANYNALYKKARETDPDRKVPVEPISSLLIENPEIQHLGWVQGWLNKSAKSVAAKTGEEAVPFTEATLAELHDLRSKANDISATGGKEGYYAGKVRAAIDATMENAPESAAAWREANAAFKAHKLEFEETGAVDRLVADKTRNDPRTALEDTWKKSIQTAKLEEIRQLKRSLLSGGDETTRAAGKKALRELRQETVNQYLNYITRKTATNEAGETQITAVQMVEGLKAIGGEARLKEILGARAVKELQNIIEAAKITKTEPSIRNAGSSTLQNILAFAEKWTDKVPGGTYLGGAIRSVGKLREMGEAGRVAREASKDPLQSVAKKARASANTLREWDKVKPQEDAPPKVSREVSSSAPAQAGMQERQAVRADQTGSPKEPAQTVKQGSGAAESKATSDPKVKSSLKSTRRPVNDYEKRADNLAKAFESVGLNVRRDSSGVSKSEYVEVEIPNTEGETIKFRVSDHKLPSHHPQAHYDVQANPGVNHMDVAGDWLDAAEWFSKKYGVPVPKAVKAVRTVQKREAAAAKQKMADSEQRRTEARATELNDVKKTLNSGTGYEIKKSSSGNYELHVGGKIALKILKPERAEVRKKAGLSESASREELFKAYIDQLQSRPPMTLKNDTNLGQQQ